jgi:hypothetical protein
MKLALIKLDVFTSMSILYSSFLLNVPISLFRVYFGFQEAYLIPVILLRVG